MNASIRNPQSEIRNGFTLVELLVVVAIIVILIAIMLPGMEQAIARAQIARCAANHHQILVGHVGYTLDNKAMVPPSWNSDGNFGCNNYGDPAVFNSYPNSFGSLIPYAFSGGGRAVFICPSAIVLSGNPYSDTNYFFNSAVSGRNTGNIPHPSSIAFTSGWTYRTTNLYYRPIYGLHGAVYNSWSGAQTYNSHHLNGGNLGFGDAHAEYRKVGAEIHARDFGLTGGSGVTGDAQDDSDIGTTTYNAEF